jgi:YidC/Oxa1 family membrane protein insertase
VSILNPLFEAVAWVLMQIHAGLSTIFGANSGWAWGLSIVLLVMLMRLIMVPLFVKQVRSQRKMQAHMPQMREIQKRYKHDKQRQQEEMMKFYKENGINPLGGCLPLVAQLPVFWSLFYVLRSIAEWTPGHPTSYGLPVSVVKSALNAHIFGALLSDKVLFTGTLHVPLHAKIVILVFVVISSTTTFLTMRQSQKRGMMQQPTVDPDNPAANMTKYMMYISPLFALTGLYWQFGLVIYWVTTNVWTLCQQHILFRNLPTVGSTTADSSTAPATRPASGTAAAKTGTTRSTTAKTGTARTGTAKAGAAKGGTAKTAPARTGTTAAKTGTAKPAATGTAKPAAAKTGSTAAKTGTAKTGAAKPSTAKAAASEAATAIPDEGGKTSASAANGTSAKSTSAAKPKATSTAKGKSGVNGTNGRSAVMQETAQDTPSGSGGFGGLLRFGKGKAEPEPEPVEETRVVRQQPVRQTRSKRSGKR